MDLGELVFFTDDINDWNFSKLVTNPDLDPYTNKLVNNNGYYNQMKYNMCIMLKEILKQSNNIFHEDILEWVNKKCFQKSKSDFHDILSITAHLFHYSLNSNEPINYKAFRKWCLKNPFYYNSFSEKSLDDFEGDDNYEKQRQKEKYDANMTYNILFKKCTDIYLNSDDPNDLIKSRNYVIILQFLKKRIFQRSALHKLY
jgi:hypothetical protein